MAGKIKLTNHTQDTIAITAISCVVMYAYKLLATKLRTLKSNISNDGTADCIKNKINIISTIETNGRSGKMTNIKMTYWEVKITNLQVDKNNTCRNSRVVNSSNTEKCGLMRRRNLTLPTK